MSLTKELDIHVCAGDNKRSDDCLTLSLAKKEKATSKSCCYSARWSSGYSWLRAKLKETLSAMSDACVMLFDLARTIGKAYSI